MYVCFYYPSVAEQLWIQRLKIGIFFSEIIGGCWILTWRSMVFDPVAHHQYFHFHLFIVVLMLFTSCIYGRFSFSFVLCFVWSCFDPLTPSAFLKCYAYQFSVTSSGLRGALGSRVPRMYSSLCSRGRLESCWVLVFLVFLAFIHYFSFRVFFYVLGWLVGYIKASI